MSDLLSKIKPWLGDGKDCGWWVFPSQKSPRFIIPCERSTWDAALSLVHGRKKFLLHKLLWLYKMIGKRADLTGSLENKLTEVGNVHLDGSITGVAIYIGTESIYKKYTVQLQGTKGTPIAYAKVADAAGSYQSIEDESAALEMLSSQLPNESFFPKLLISKKGFSLQTCPQSIARSQVGLNQVMHFLRCLKSLDNFRTSWLDSPIREQIIEFQDSTLLESDSLIQKSMTTLDRLQWEDLEHHLMHGDFVAWNMHSDFLYDWEWAGPNIGYHDFFHYIWFPIIQRGSKALIADCLAAMELNRCLLIENAPSMKQLKQYAYLYVLWRLSFYRHSCLKNNDDPDQYPFIHRFVELEQYFESDFST